MNQNFAIKIRIKPNKKQKELIAKHFGCKRFLWNHFLAERIQQYKENQLNSTYVKDCKKLTELKRQAGKEWLYEVDACSQQRAIKKLDDAYKSFFKGNTDFPNFKSKKHQQSYQTVGNISIKAKRVCFPKFSEGIKFNRKLPVFDKINNITIKQTATGLYYAILSVEGDITPLPVTNQSVGVDLGIIDFAVTSDGEKIKNPKHLNKHSKKLAQAQKHLARKNKGSNRRNKQRIKVAKIHAKIANVRADFHHKLSRKLINQYDFIGLESLKVKNMVKNHKLAKSISDCGWTDFVRMIDYKAAWYGRTVTQIGQYFPSTKMCHGCGFVHQSISLNMREFDCQSCGVKLDRDVNASKNILFEAKRLSLRSSGITNTEAA